MIGSACGNKDNIIRPVLMNGKKRNSATAQKRAVLVWWWAKKCPKTDSLNKEGKEEIDEN
jgi:hypothetical protein